MIRPAAPADHDGIWAILEPIIRAGETYPLPRNMDRDSALAYWTSPAHEVFVAERAGALVGTYYIRPNQPAGGAHVANCGYMVAAQAAGQGLARAMAAHSFAHAKASGFRAMQFNFVVSTNRRAVALWTSLGFETLCRLPGAFAHPVAGFVDALVMFKHL